jgi:mannose-6-phosphate isomerase
MLQLYPLRFIPVYKHHLWGGSRFRSVLGRELATDRPYAESWEISDHPAGQSIVQSGPLAGTALGDLMKSCGSQILGRHYPRPRFPLLLKYLDADQRLSLQVHPDDALAAKLGLSDPGKTEAWYIVHAEPGSSIWCGFQRPARPEDLRAAIAAGRLDDWLYRFQPAAGQCLFIPPGTIHTLGDGVLVAEIQQTSDTTFRLFDWNRLGPDGNPRQLHVDQGLLAIDYQRTAVQPVQARRLRNLTALSGDPPQGDRALSEPPSANCGHVDRLVDCDKFILDRWRLEGRASIGGDDRCHLLTVIQGAMQLAGDWAEHPLAVGQSCLIPAAIGPVCATPGSMPVVFLDAYLP